MNIFGLQVTGDHVRLLVPILGVVGGFLAGRWSRHRGSVHFKKEDLVTSSVVIEMYGIKKDADGSDILHVITQGSSASIESFFNSPDLVGHVKRQAIKHPGLLQLPNQVARRMMMDEGKDKITGLDPKANMDFVHGRTTQDDETCLLYTSPSPRDS